MEGVPSQIKPSNPMKPNTDTLVRQSREFAQSQLTPVFNMQSDLRVPIESYDFLVRNDSRGTSAAPEAVLENAEARTPSHAPLVVYTHVPTCAYRCKFCTFGVTTEKTLRDIAANLLLKEVRNFLEHRPWLAGKKLSTLYFGGGTPTTLS